MNTRSKGVTKANFLADANPVIFAEFSHIGEGGFAGSLEIIIPDGGEGEIVIIPEFTFVFGAIGGESGVTGANRI